MVWLIRTLSITLSLLLCVNGLASSTYYLQAGVFSHEKNADKFSERLVKLSKHKVRIKPLQQKGKTLYLVQVDPLKDKKQATLLRQHLKAQGINSSLHQHDDKNTKRLANNIQTTTPPKKQVSIPQKKPAIRQGTNKIKPAPSRLWNLRNADIRSVIREVSRETGKNFLVDQRVQGKISIISSTPMSPREVYPVFLAALQISGYAAIERGKVTKIVPAIDSNKLSTAVASSVRPGTGDENVVRVIPVKFVTAQQLVPILRPLMPQWSQVSAYAPSNMLILSGRASNLKRLAKIVRRVDVSSHGDFNMIRLRHATAQDIVKTIKSLQGEAKGSNPRVSVAVDERNNAVIISGNKAARLRLRVLISALDAPSATGGGDDTQVIALQYMQAKDMLPILAGIAKSHYKGPVETVMGTRTLTDLEKGDTGISSGTSTTSSGTATPSSSASTGDSTKQRIVEIIGEPNTNSIIINAPPSLMRSLRRIIRKIDVRPTQVAIEALIVEIDEDNVHDLGVRWGSRDNLLGVTNANIFRPGFGIISANHVSDFEAQLKALETDNKTDILSTPSVVVLDNHLAHIQVGEEISIATTRYPNNAGGTTGATPFTTFTRKPAALVLKVTPQVSHDGTIKLNIIQENNSVKALPVGSAQSESPPFNISEISTSVIVNDGDILVFGGLIKNELTRTDESIPILGSIPIIGRLFHQIKNTRKKKKLMVFLHPVILHDNRQSSSFSSEKYNGIRREQLESLVDYPYHKDLHENVLPDRGVIELPKPFSMTYMTKQGVFHYSTSK